MPKFELASEHLWDLGLRVKIGFVFQKENEGDAGAR